MSIRNQLQKALLIGRIGLALLGGTDGPEGNCGLTSPGTWEERDRDDGPSKE